jgi:hypothetical protein
MYVAMRFIGARLGNSLFVYRPIGCRRWQPLIGTQPTELLLAFRPASCAQPSYRCPMAVYLQTTANRSKRHNSSLNSPTSKIITQEPHSVLACPFGALFDLCLHTRLVRMATSHDWQWRACQRFDLVYPPSDRLETKSGHSPERKGGECCTDGHEEQSAFLWISHLRLSTHWSVVLEALRRTTLTLRVAGQTYVATAAREIILSAGVFNT